MRHFFSKILLFGEYAIIKGSQALAIPCHKFKGNWEFLNQKNAQHDLRPLLAYLQKKQTEQAFDFDLNLEDFEMDISAGLQFVSNIPLGYGLGSSGALCAGILAQYAQVNPTHTDLLQLKNTLALMESYFHGASSGIDPLLSFLEKPLLLNAEQPIQIVKLPTTDEQQQGVFFLIDTQKARKTEPLVHIFLEKCQEKQFLEKCVEPLKTQNKCAIEQFLQGKSFDLFETFRSIAALQVEHFQEMIPQQFEAYWHKGLEATAPFSIKLCGAGGGGFLLGYTLDWQATQSALPAELLTKVFPS